MRTPAVPSLLLAASLALSACGDEDEAQVDTRPVATAPAASDPSTTAVRPDDGFDGGELEERTFVATSISEGGAERPLVAGSELRISFFRGELGADVGCNSMGGGYAIEGRTLTTSDLTTEELGCPAPRDEQDAWLFALLGRPLTVAVDGRELTLSAGAVEVRLTEREVPPRDVSVFGTPWVLDTLVDGDVAASVPDGVDASVIFGTDGIYRLDTGCNTGGALYTESGTARGSTITVQEPRLTRKTCDDVAGEVEAAMGAVFNGQVTVQVEGDRLTLTKGTRGLGFTAEPHP